MNGIRESFLSLNLFSLSFKIYFMALLRWAIAPIAPPMDPSLSGISVRTSRIHADNILLSSLLSSSTLWFVRPAHQ